MMLRAVSVVVGLGLLIATAHVTIEHTGGYETPHAILTMAIAIGVAVGALAIGSAFGHRRYAVAVCIALSLIAGEAFGLLRTAERLVEAREIAQAPLRLKEQERAKAVQRVERAETTLAGMGETSPRIAAALAAKQVADQAVAESAAKRGCASNCRKLLEAQLVAAGVELKAARAALNAQRNTARIELQTAREALARFPVVRSSTPLADRLGLPSWGLDVLMAVLGSLGANGLGAALLAFGGHSGAVPAKHPQGSKEQAATMFSPAIPNVREHTSAYCLERLQPAEGRYTTLRDIHDEYFRWCRAHNHPALASKELGQALADLFKAAGLTVSQVDSQPVVLGVELKAAEPKLIEAA